jgi:hypothetical protein
VLPIQILMFSYGSGAAGSMFILRGRRSGNPRFGLDLLSRKVAWPVRQQGKVILALTFACYTYGDGDPA